MGLAEILAKKKAAAETAALQVEKAIIAESTVQQAAPVEEQKPVEEAPAPVPAPAASAEKPLTFAEKMALKKQQAAAQEAPAPAVSPIAAMEEKPVAAAPSAPLSFADKLRAQKEAVKAAQTVVQEKTEIDPERIPADPDEAQSFVDIVTKINDLKSLMEDDLKEGMSALKAAIKKNPSAADLLLDEELGLMVVALRRMRGITITEATKEKKPGAKKPKAKEVALSAEELEAAWSEL